MYLKGFGLEPITLCSIYMFLISGVFVILCFLCCFVLYSGQMEREMAAARRLEGRGGHCSLTKTSWPRTNASSGTTHSARDRER